MLTLVTFYGQLCRCSKTLFFYVLKAWVSAHVPHTLSSRKENGLTAMSSEAEAEANAESEHSGTDSDVGDIFDFVREEVQVRALISVDVS